MSNIEPLRHLEIQDTMPFVFLNPLMLKKLRTSKSSKLVKIGCIINPKPLSLLAKYKFNSHHGRI
jgi:hypothetical protein